MKGEWEMRRRFAVAAAALALSAALTVPAYAGTWKYVNDQWKYQKGTNKFAYNEWIKDNGKYYYIGNDGIMKIDRLSGGCYDRHKGQEERKTWNSLLHGGGDELGTFRNLQ